MKTMLHVRAHLGEGGLLGHVGDEPLRVGEGLVAEVDDDALRAGLDLLDIGVAAQDLDR